MTVCMQTDDLLTLKEAANYLKVNPQTLRRAVKNNLLIAYRVGNHPNYAYRQLRFERAQLDAYIVRKDH